MISSARPGLGDLYPGCVVGQDEYEELVPYRDGLSLIGVCLGEAENGFPSICIRGVFRIGGCMVHIMGPTEDWEANEPKPR